MAYFIGSNSPASGFGAGGNFFSELGSIGPAWQRSMLQGLQTQHAFNEFQNQQLVDPFRVQATAASYGQQALQGDLNSQHLIAQMNALAAMRGTGSVQQAQQESRNLGVNPTQMVYGNPLIRNAPKEAQPTTSALTGNYAATAPVSAQTTPPLSIETQLYGTPTAQPQWATQAYTPEQTPYLTNPYLPQLY